MPDILEKINKLASLGGYSLNPNDIISKSLIESDILEQQSLLNALRSTIELLQIQLTAVQTESESQAGLTDDVINQAPEEVEKAKKKSLILKQFIHSIVEDDEFILNKLTRENRSANEFYYKNMQPLKDQARQIESQLKELVDLQKRCDALKQKIMGYQANRLY